MALERTGGVMVYDVTDPDNSEFVNYINSRDFAGIVSGSEAYDKDELDKWVTGGDVAPEGLAFIPAAQSPTGRDLLLAACEVSGTVAVYELTPNQTEEPDQPDQPDDDDDDDRPSHSGGSSGPDRNTVSVDSGTDHGTVTVNPTRAQEGDTVTVTVRPDDGYELDRLTVTGRDAIHVRTYERGVEGETLACGTGAAASTCIAHALGLTDCCVNVTTSGKELLGIELRGDSVFLSGAVARVFTGVLDPSMFSLLKF